MADQQNTMCFVENVLLIWVDAKLNPEGHFDHDTQRSITALYQLANSIKLFDRCETCIDFLTDKLKEEKVFLIVSGAMGERLIPRVEHDIRLDSIYIFCWKKSKYEQWTCKEQHQKVIGIFTDIRDVCQQLKEDIKHCQHELTSIQTLGSQTSKIVNHLDASFMYSQLLKEILLSTDQEQSGLEPAKDKFVEFCRIQYAKNSAELGVIEEFNENYSKSTAIWWYTRECFVYSMLNRALAVQDAEILIRMSFFIYDLHRQLEHLHKTRNDCQVLTVYRGQGMLHAAFNRLRENQGGLISFNNFLSTSTSKEVSLRFAENALKKPDKLAILFELTIDPSISSVPFASLDQLSYFNENENEILFSMHTVFRIDQIKSIDNGNQPPLWQVHLTSTKGDDEQLRQLAEHMRMELTSLLTSELQTNMDPMWRLGKLLVNMGEYEKALAIWEMILDKATRENNCELVQATHYQMAEFFMIYQNDWNRAVIHFRKMFSMEPCDARVVVDHAKDEMTHILATIRDLLADEQVEEDDFHASMAELLSKLVSLYRNHSAQLLSPLDYQLIVDRYNYIGWVRKRQGNVPSPWIQHERALELLREHLPPSHPRFALTYSHIGLLHLAVNNHLNALDCFERALHIQEKALRPYHVHLAETHFQLSIIFERLDQIDDAFQHAKKAVDIGRHAFLTSKNLQMKQYREQFHRIRSLTHSCDELVL